MDKVTPEKTHALLEKLATYVMNKVARKDEVPTKKEMNDRFELVDKRFDQVEIRLDKVEAELVETKKDVKSILNGMDNQVKDMEILRTEQIAIHSGLRRLETRVDGIERKSA